VAWPDGRILGPLRLRSVAFTFLGGGGRAFTNLPWRQQLALGSAAMGRSGLVRRWRGRDLARFGRVWLDPVHRLFGNEEREARLMVKTEPTSIVADDDLSICGVTFMRASSL
jgi:hypothetical protein